MCLVACLLMTGATAAWAQATPSPKPAEVAPDQPVPQVITAPRDEGAPPASGEPGEAGAAADDDEDQPSEPDIVLPRSGLGGVLVEPDQHGVDLTGALARYTPPEGDQNFATYLVDLVNTRGEPQTRILILDTGVYGGRGAPEGLSSVGDEVVVRASNLDALVDVLDRGVRTRVRVEIPPEDTLTISLRYPSPPHALSAELWDEAALARAEMSAFVMQGVLMGLTLACVGWLGAYAVLRGGAARRLALLAAAAFVALATGFGVTPSFNFGGVFTSAGLALGAFALSAALALRFVVRVFSLPRRWGAGGKAIDLAVWAIAATAALALFNAPYSAVFAKLGAASGLALCVAVVLARAWSGDTLARRFAPSALLALTAFAPLGMLELVDGAAVQTTLAAAALLVGALLLLALAVVVALSASGGRHRPPEPVATAAAPPPFPRAGRAAMDDQDGRLGLALAAAHQGIWDWDLKADRLFLSPAVEALLGAGPGELAPPSRNWEGRIHESDLATFVAALEDYRSVGDVAFVLDFRAIGGDGRARWVQLRASFMSDGEGAARCIGLVSDVSAQKEGEALLLASARQDAISGLANRAFFIEALGHRIAFAGPSHPYGLFVFDLARFRVVNDVLGHGAADALLKAVGDRVRASAPDNALPARLGGDIFALLWACDDADAAAEAAKTVLDAISVPMDVAEARFTPVVRGGLVVISGDHHEADDLLGDADAALAEARRGGPGAIAVFAPQMRDSRLERIELERDLGDALERDEIVLHYQPIIRVSDRRPAGFEALLRWNHPSRGLLAAEAFAALAEDTGAIDRLGAYALATAIRDRAALAEAADGDERLFMNVNVSARQLASPAFVQFCERLAREHRLQPGEIRLEITETLAISDVEGASAAFARLRAAGFGLVMDDFGAGHSSPARLAALSFDAVKIDRAFLAGGDSARSVLTGLLRLARELGLETTAEGVQSADDLDFLAAQACDYAQGYYFAMPDDIAATRLWLADAGQLS